MAMPTVHRARSTRITARPPVRMPSFRDDINLVSIRYEKTLQGEAPIPITTVNPIRTPSRPTSSASRSTSPSSPSPVIVHPPREPPEEEHPALRSESIIPPKEGWKRDSGHGATNSSRTPTIDEEDCEDELEQVEKLMSELAVVQQVDAQPDGAARDVADDGLQSDKHTWNPANPVSTPDQLQRPMSPARFVFGDGETFSTADANAAAPGSGSKRSPSLRISPSGPAAVSVATTQRVRPRSAATEAAKKATPVPHKNLVKSFSFRSVSSLWTPTSFSPSGSGPIQASAPKQPLMRGSPSPEPEPEAALADSGPSSPGTPESSSRTRKSSGAITVPSLWKRQRKSSSQNSMSQQAQRDIADPNAPYSPLSLSLSTDGLLDDDFLADLSFSKRGSIMFGGQRAFPLVGTTSDSQQQSQPPTSRDQPRASVDNGTKPSPSPTNHLSPSATPASESGPRSESVASNETPDTGFVTPDAVPLAQQQPQNQSQSQPQDPQLLSVPPDIRVMAADVDRDSQKVRSLYAANDTLRWEDGALPSLGGYRTASPIEEVSAEEDEQDPYAFLAPCSLASVC